MRDVVRHERRCAAGLDEMVRQDDEGRGIRNHLVGRVVPGGPGDAEARRREGFCDRVGAVDGKVRRHLERQPGWFEGARRRERPVDLP
ncbi:hypothetical protein GCM10009777_29840 [Microbacterium pumilum]|uniref:Uncharacterized protein n=1 Tax=Microbacterium pumilum TaxID=344165 RepID=A0ABN2SUJ8_9MICO